MGPSFEEDCETLPMISSPAFMMPKDQVLSWRFLTSLAENDLCPEMEQTRQRHFFFFARNAIYHGLKALNISQGSRILVPSYICAAAVEPMVAYGVRVDFYRIGRDCQPDFPDIETRICSQTQAIMAVHYFGFPQKIREFRELCDRRGLALIEDCAHVLRTEVNGQRLGTFGDTSIYSWRKFFPIYDGGELLLNRSKPDFKVDWNRESWLLTLKVARNMFHQVCVQPGHPVLKIISNCLQYAQGIWNWGGETADEHASIRSVHNNSASFSQSLVNQPISRVSRLTLMHSDVRAVIESRRNNYLYLQSELGSLDGVRLLFPNLPLGVCPWIFPIFFDGITDAHLALRQKAVPAVTWQGVRQPGICKTAYPDADFLYDNLVFLPVHQNLSEKALRAVVESVKAVRRTNR